MTAINRKIEQYYISEEYTFRIEREKKELERKKIEAQGVRDFQQIVTQGISDFYLRWRGIEATLQLAQSPNAKTVIIGSGKEGLPIILGNVDAPSPPPKGSSPSNTPSEQRTTAPTPSTDGKMNALQPAGDPLRLSFADCLNLAGCAATRIRSTCFWLYMGQRCAPITSAGRFSPRLLGIWLPNIAQQQKKKAYDSHRIKNECHPS